MKNLIKLQRLCDIANRRYDSGQNTDDQDKRLFDFSKQINDACVLIGYNDYQAISTNEVISFYKENKDLTIKEEKGFCYFKMNFKTVQIKKELLD